MILAICSALARGALILILIRLITELRDVLSWRERIGAGFMGGSGFLTIAVIMDVSKAGTPYDTWAGLTFSVGACVFFWGFLDRKLGHQERNEKAKRIAHQHLTERGKL